MAYYWPLRDISAWQRTERSLPVFCNDDKLEHLRAPGAGSLRRKNERRGKRLGATPSRPLRASPRPVGAFLGRLARTLCYELSSLLGDDPTSQAKVRYRSSELELIDVFGRHN